MRNGCGILPDVLPRVVDPYFSTKGVGRGSGLGLSHAYGFTSESGGELEIQSEAGAGTIVKLYLPTSSLADHDMALRNESEAHAPAARGESILVVENEPAVLNTVAECLEGWGYRVLRASNAAEAMRLVEADEPIDIVFSDVVMPDSMNGVQLADQVRRLRPNVRILLTSGYPADALSAEHGVRDDIPLLMKPYRPKQLASRLTGLG